MIPLSLAHLTVLDVGPPELFDLAAQAGYQDVGIRVLPAIPGAVSYPLSAPAVKEWRRRMRAAGVGVYDVEFIPLTPEVEVARYAETLALAAELGARRLNVSGDDADFGRVAEKFAALCDLAAPLGIGVDLEFMRFRIVANLAQAKEIVTRAARPNGRILLDVMHFYGTGGTAEQLRQAPARLFGTVQLCDGPAKDPGDAGAAQEAREARLFPGEGEFPIVDYLNALPAGLPVGVELPTAGSHPELSRLQRATRACATSRRVLESWRPSR